MKHFARMIQHDGECAYCGLEFSETNRRQIEHMRPVSRGGPTVPENLVPACRPCNIAKGRRTPKEWKVEIRRRMRAHISAFMTELSRCSVPDAAWWQLRDAMLACSQTVEEMPIRFGFEPGFDGDEPTTEPAPEVGRDDGSDSIH